ncbi:MAG: M10 family metallopeptidase, partial [Kordiimonas sp.]
MSEENVISGVESIPEGSIAKESGDALVDSLILGGQFAADENGLTWISYSFPDANSNWSSVSYSQSPTEEQSSDPFHNLMQVSEVSQKIFLSAFNELSRLTGLEFVRVPDEGENAGTIRAAWTHQPGDESVGWANPPSFTPAASDIWLNSAKLSEVGGFFKYVVWHEIGHAVGLKHPFEQEEGFDFPILPAQYDGYNNTIMSYSPHSDFPTAYSTSLYPQTFMYFDIQTLQYLYGKDTETSAGSDVYSYDLTYQHYLTIWDAGGNDTLMVSGGNKPLKLNITPGTWSDVGTIINYHDRDGNFVAQQKHTVFIAPDTVVENAVGADGDDEIIGNDEDNVLTGNGGSDTLLGNDGNDSFWAGKRDDAGDRMDGGAGNDVIGGGVGADTLSGGEGSDILYGGKDADILTAGDWSNGVVTTTEEANNSLWAGDGNDTLYGANGDDKMGGGEGDDLILAHGGKDVVYGGKSGNDTVDGGAGADRIFAGVGDDSIEGGTGNDELYGGVGDDFVSAGSGTDTLYGGGGNDTLIGGEGADTF